MHCMEFWKFGPNQCEFFWKHFVFFAIIDVDALDSVDILLLEFYGCFFFCNWPCNWRLIWKRKEKHRFFSQIKTTTIKLEMIQLTNWQMWNRTFISSSTKKKIDIIFNLIEKKISFGYCQKMNYCFIGSNRISF